MEFKIISIFENRIRKSTFDLSLSVVQKRYRFSRAALWIGTTFFTILVLPVVFETEKLQVEQLQQRQIFLGPNTGSAASPGKKHKTLSKK
uniref:Mitochondrial import receptor subunit TOM22 homolog n=1 Tax=Castor canadensis TaxID=51338 RepID=A0A8C0XHH1_CASCN